jgi:hypothetical protein
MNEDFALEQFPILDATDHDILMHRDAHFGGQFSVMLEYYRNESRGVQAEFSLARIESLSKLEQQIKQNLAALFLNGSEAQKVADARQMYQKLREIYEIQKPTSVYPRLIADLILTEDEEAIAEIAAIIGQKEAIVPCLLTLLRDDTLYDPLFPGYGQTPLLVIKCLEKIGDKRALISLFEAFGEGDFFMDEQIVKAFQVIGEPAQNFLLPILSTRPFNEDNEKAAIILIAFKDNERVAEKCFRLLQESDVQKDPCLSTYLVLASEGLVNKEQRSHFKALAIDPRTPPILRADMQEVLNSWNSANEEKVS